MSPIFDCRDEAQLLTGMRQARQAIGRGELVVIPTDTVYGVAADAFDAKAVERLLAAKGRGRQSPPPVLVAGITTLRALVADVPEPVERLVEAFWPGGLTIVLPTARWPCGCRNTGSPSSCSKKPGPWLFRARTSPAWRRVSPPRTPRGC
jgi:tRNA A37 threonylcarbamoyladenosine synthetase subunit TsaC/SUA5/YrdC